MSISKAQQLATQACLQFAEGSSAEKEHVCADDVTTGS